MRLTQNPNTQHLGTTVWDASIVLAKFLEKVGVQAAHGAVFSLRHKLGVTYVIGPFAEHAKRRFQQGQSEGQEGAGAGSRYGEWHTSFEC